MPLCSTCLTSAQSRWRWREAGFGPNANQNHRFPLPRRIPAIGTGYREDALNKAILIILPDISIDDAPRGNASVQTRDRDHRSEYSLTARR